MKELMPKILTPGIIFLLAFFIVLLTDNINVLVAVVSIVLIEFQGNILVVEKDKSWEIVLKYAVKLLCVVAALLLFKIKFTL